jgi:acyl-CoA hydrolase
MIHSFSGKGRKKMVVQSCEISHVVMGADLNHHGTLFAGQGAKWFVEAGFIAAANLTRPENIVCVNIHGMQFRRPAPAGTVIRFVSRIVLTGNTRLVCFVRAVISRTEELLVEGFLTFVHVDHDGRPLPHGITIEAVTPEDLLLQEQAKAL